MNHCDFDWYFVATQGFKLGIGVGAAVVLLVFACAVAFKRWRKA